jgi:hypothetical protein
MSNGILLTSWSAALLLLSFDILRILFLYRVGVRDFSLRHDVCVLFKGTFAGCEDAKSETDECRPSTPAHADAAGGCGRVQGLTNFGQALFRSSKSRRHPWPPQLSFFPPNSFTGMFYCRSQRRDLAYLFLLCYVIQDQPLHRSWSAL